MYQSKLNFDGAPPQRVVDRKSQKKSRKPEKVDKKIPQPPQQQQQQSTTTNRREESFSRRAFKAIVDHFRLAENDIETLLEVSGLFHFNHIVWSHRLNNGANDSRILISQILATYDRLIGNAFKFQDRFSREKAYFEELVMFSRCSPNVELSSHPHAFNLTDQHQKILTNQSKFTTNLLSFDKTFYSKVLKKDELFPFTPHKFRNYLADKHNLLKLNIRHSDGGEQTGFLYSYTKNAKIPLPNLCIVQEQNGRIQAITSLQLKSVSYDGLDSFFFNTEQIRDDYPLMRQFLRNFHKILHGTLNFDQFAEEKTKNEEEPRKNKKHYEVLWIQIAELLMFEEGARYLGSIVHIVMWIALQEYYLTQGKHKLFVTLPFAMGGAVEAMRGIRANKIGFSLDNFEYFYDYSVELKPKPKSKLDNAMTSFEDSERQLFQDFFTTFAGDQDRLSCLKLHLISFFHINLERLGKNAEKRERDTPLGE